MNKYVATVADLLSTKMLFLVSIIGFLLVAVVIALTFRSTPSFAVLDKKMLFDHYYHDLQRLTRNNSHTEDLNQVLKAKNKHFIHMLSYDLDQYQRQHHVMILKRSALLAPSSPSVASQDITKQIIQKLKSQGMLS